MSTALRQRCSQGSAETYKATETKAMVGAQGRADRVLQSVDGGYRLVVIDTYLAKVNDVVAEKTDSKGHVTRDDYLQLSRLERC